MFQTIIHTIIFAMKHEKPEVMEIGLKSLWDLNDKLGSEPQVCTIFYKAFFTTILKETIEVMTDCRHLAGFKFQCKIIKQLIEIVENNLILEPIEVDGQAH